MAAIEPGKIRNVAVVGHRGTGKTSLVEALLYQTGEVNRLGTIEAGTTVCDWDEDEQKRRMSISLALAHTSWQGRKINLIDAPGDPSFQGESHCALRVVEGALVVVNGVMGLEVGTARVKSVADGLGLSRVLFVNMLDRERADFYRTLAQIQEQFSSKCVAVHLPIGSEHSLRGIVDVLHMCAYLSPDGGREGDPVPVPDDMAEVAQEYREKLLDEVVQTDEALMEQYLEGGELDAHAVTAALKLAVTRGEVFPVACGVATQNLGTHALLDLIVEGVPSPGKKGAPIEVAGASTAAFVFKTLADPFAGRINLFRVLKGEVGADSTLVDARGHAKERMGTLLQLQGKEHTSAKEFGEGDIGAVAKLKDVQTGDLLSDREIAAELPEIAFPEPVMSFAITPRTKGEEEKVATAIRRLAEEDPTLRLRRDPQTGEEILSGMSQMHVEVALERAKRRFGVDIELHPPRVPYLETIRAQARAQGRYKKQTGGRGQFGDCHIVIEPIDGGVGYEFVDKIVGGVIPQSFRPAVDKGIQEAMAHGELAGAPVQGVRVELVDGSYHTVDSSEMAFKIAGSMAWKEAYAKASPVLLEPIMELEVTVPDEAVGAVNGDLNARRGRLHGMEPAGGMTTIKAEVPLAELLTYAQSLTSMTGGRGEYAMHFLRYEEVPAHVAQKVIEETRKAREAAGAA
ncbi:Translation elongation factors (GTPases) [Gaiella occulta]|uniref:Translation elongation factors (GTPases) n=1 Tax=Gaiella occulta TaxID=1002870 RepID=A0A7M2YZ88_9ACTN|nr:elongation factor G [Gaiella occulta]RDI75339.1 Translation elongation factors (GTPases) [Gaiella occulta]